MTDAGMNEEQIAQLEAFKIVEAVGGSSAITALGPYIRRMELPLLDYMTIRDLLELGGCQGDAGIVVVLMAMFAGLQEGSICLNLDKGPFLNRLPVDAGKNADALWGDFLSGLREGRRHRLITRNPGEYMPLILDESSGRSLLYFQKYHAHEKRLKDRMEAFLNADVSLPLHGQQIDAFLGEIYSDPLVIRANHTPLARDPLQLEAIRLALTSQFSIISGGPGTGKTSLVVNILRCLVRAGVQAPQIVLGAPTGRAAQRMTEMVQKNISAIRQPSRLDSTILDLKGSTLHKILRYRSHDNDFYYKDSNPLPASVVVIDEVSMVDVVLLDKFLQALDPERTRLVLLGDKDQLPSVEAGAVLADMIPDGTRAGRFKDRFVVLQEVYRSGVHLLNLARQLNTGAFPKFRPVKFQDALGMEPDQWAFVQAEGLDKWRQHLHRWVARHYVDPVYGDKTSFKELVFETGRTTFDHLATSEQGRTLLHRIFGVVERARILSFLRKGAYGCTVINALVADYLIAALGHSPKRHTQAFPGAMIIITRNDYAKELFNGDVGVIVQDANGAYRAFFHRSDSFVSFPVNLLPPWELAFAMTVHKSQGSEFDDVLLVLPDDEKHRLLSREIVYTGVTRAKKRVIIYGSRPVLESALQKKIDRQSGLVW